MLVCCSECKAVISDKAAACPKCGIPREVPSATPIPAAAPAAQAPATAPVPVPAIQPDHLIYMSWTLVGLQWISFMAAPTPRGPTAQDQMITAFLISHLVVIVLRTILVSIDRNLIERRMPGKAPGLAGTILLPVVIYLDKRRRCLGRGLWLVLVELVAMWLLPVVLVLASMK